MLLVPATQRFDVFLCATGVRSTAAQAGFEESAGDAAQPVKSRVGEPLRASPVKVSDGGLSFRENSRG